MIRNYLKTAFRSIFRNKLTAFINIAGLARHRCPVAHLPLCVERSELR